MRENHLKLKLLLVFTGLLYGCPVDQEITEIKDITYTSKPVSNFWKNATVYFLLTDRFHNGDITNDQQFDRKKDGAVLRNFEGGDILGITKKIESGYFDSLGVNAIWFTPVFEQIHGHTDEGTGKTYAYHGYWTRDWTALDPNFGTENDLLEMVKTAHEHGIRVLLDAVINHTGPVTDTDSQWPDDWVRTAPTCKFEDLASTVECTLVDNLPDIKTESTQEVSIPDFLMEKWRKSGKYEKENEELNVFFANTGYPRYPFYYIIKWLTDWVKKLGIDGFRVDTAKHTEAYVWSVLKKECERALQIWRDENPGLTIHSDPFFMVGEVYGYGASGGRDYNYGDQKVDFFAHGFESLINFEFKYDAKGSYDSLFTKYSLLLNDPGFRDLTVLNYLASHDDGDPFDRERQKTYETANKLLLSPGAAQIYYGDELARPLQADSAKGDANLRSFMNWEEMSSNMETRALLRHWQKLGSFRANHAAIGAGSHQMISQAPYTFSRSLGEDVVVIGLDHSKGEKIINVKDVFAEGIGVKDYYSGTTSQVQDGQLKINSDYSTFLLEKN